MNEQLMAAMSSLSEDRTPEQTAIIEAHEAHAAASEACKEHLGPLASRNVRELISNRLLLALLEGTTPDTADVAALKRAIEVASPYVEAG